ncbi:MAG TPA: hypothetical protein VFA48_11495 [Gammaproteobacteria bacterium]|nr:hypothetical protein [Gammaproteobacteria bacterium]
MRRYKYPILFALSCAFIIGGSFAFACAAANSIQDSASSFPGCPAHGAHPDEIRKLEGIRKGTIKELVNCLPTPTSTRRSKTMDKPTPLAELPAKCFELADAFADFAKNELAANAASYFREIGRELEAALRAQESEQGPVGDYVYIWSDEHHAYWRPNAAGYTYDVLQAGVYNRSDAEAHTRNSGPEKKIKLIPAHPQPRKVCRWILDDEDALFHAECDGGVDPVDQYTCPGCGGEIEWVEV